MVKNTQPINAVMKRVRAARRERRTFDGWIFQWRDARLNKSSASGFDVDLSDRLIPRWTGASDVFVSMGAFAKPDWWMLDKCEKLLPLVKLFRIKIENSFNLLNTVCSWSWEMSSMPSQRQSKIMAVCFLFLFLFSQ